MIRDVIAEAWAQSPAHVLAVLIATPFTVIATWLWLVVIITAFGGSA